MLKQKFLAINWNFICIITYTQKKKERFLKLMSIEGLLKRKAATAQSLPNLLHSKIYQKV